MKQFTFHSHCNKYFFQVKSIFKKIKRFIVVEKKVTSRKNKFSPQQLLLPEQTISKVEYFSHIGVELIFHLV